ncbi:phage tail protein [Stutzerimonas nitrititolerans]|uniref:phage tail protein n=1 Tax=Stutzerimonas nitrititolerans TaxID=2482751 RepID=UPI0028ABF008|nr:phage tail protein [Stutzerimonas nitrititolerans]
MSRLFYRDKDGVVYEYETKKQRDRYGASDLDAMTAEQICEHLNPPPHAPTIEQLLTRIDTAADTARARVAGDPLRAVEYDLARLEAQAYAEAGYPADAVPRTVAAWAINRRSPQQAADSILVEAAAYTDALYLLREIRLRAKEEVRIRMDAGEIDAAQKVASEAASAIEAAVAGIGNA